MGRSGQWDTVASKTGQLTCQPLRGHQDHHTHVQTLPSTGGSFKALLCLHWYQGLVAPCHVARHIHMDTC